MNEKEVYGIGEVVKILGISRDRLYESLRRGYIYGTRLGPHGKWRIPHSEIERLKGKGTMISARAADEAVTSPAEVKKKQLVHLKQGEQPSQQGALQHEDQQESPGLMQRWREQLKILPVGQLLRESYLNNWRRDLERELTESEEVSRAYLQAWRRHWQTIPRPYKAMLTVESEALFQRLRKAHPDAKVWQAQESWDEAYGIYWDAFSSWVVEVEYFCELAMGFAMLEEGTNGDFDDKMRDARELIKETKRAKSDVWLFLRLLALAVACDLLRLGVGQEEPDASWVLEVAPIRELRGTVVGTSMKELPKDFWLTGRNNVYAATESLWDRHEPAKEKTIALLQALKRLHIAQNNVRDKLKALEHTLAS